jgi:hypothetical protein
MSVSSKYIEVKDGEIIQPVVSISNIELAQLIEQIKQME